MATAASAQQPQTHHWAIVVHGGAGDIDRAKLGSEGDAAYRAVLARVVQAGAAVLDHGGSSLDAVEAAIRVMEDDPLFNAGRGAVFAADGTNEMDSAIMDGATLRAGAVADVTRTRSPHHPGARRHGKDSVRPSRGSWRRCFFGPGRSRAGAVPATSSLKAAGNRW